MYLDHKVKLITYIHLKIQVHIWTHTTQVFKFIKTNILNFLLVNKSISISKPVHTNLGNGGAFEYL